jgi:hypothetical protein
MTSVASNAVRHLRGWLNWAAFVMPQLQPFMTTLYALICRMMNHHRELTHRAGATEIDVLIQG